MTSEAKPVPYLMFMVALSCYAVAALAVSTFAELPPETHTILDYADTAICILFFVDFIVTLARSEHRWRYLATWGWLDLLSSIPVVDSLRWARIARILRIIRILRGIKAAKILTEFLLYQRVQSAFLAALLISILLIVVSASAILQLETAADANIRTPEGAVWWAIVTITTVGYGDKFPLSAEGRLIAVLLMTAGVGLFGTFSGFVASWFLGAPHPESAEMQAIVKLEHEIRALREKIDDLSSRSGETA